MLFKRPRIGDFYADAELKQQIWQFNEGYKTFLNQGKTEREAIQVAITTAKAHGFVEASTQTQVKTGDKIYFINRDKNLCLMHIGQEPLTNGFNMVASHVDAPRLDLKPAPLHEDSAMVLLKTHYYGGIKKHHWVNRPLALHGVVVLKNGKTITICLGEDPHDPIFMIPDIEPHLSKNIQNERKADVVIKGEELQIIIGSLPPLNADKNDKQPLKTAITQLIADEYGFEEEDWFSAEISAVPADKARDVGLDRAMVGAYAHDDRGCVYTSLMGLLAAPDVLKRTAMVFLTDKEEIGSTGSTGMQSDFFVYSVAQTLKLLGVASDAVTLQETLWRSFCLSADVKGAFNPIYSAVYDEQNTPFTNAGPAITKYTGIRGKVGSSDADAELVAALRQLLSAHNIPYQFCVTGKVDEGGGNTIAKFVASRGPRTIDLGLPMLSMHAPCEIVSKYDIYSYYRAMTVFFSDGLTLAHG
jgi:aspartyl aminopeptidase